MLLKKYIPEHWDDVIGQNEIIRELKKYKNIDEIPHLMFIGKPGIGKTACAHVLANELGVRLVEKNASDDRGIDTIRNEVKTLLFTQGKRIILLDEADNLCLDKNTKIFVNNTTKRIEEVADTSFKTKSYDFKNEKTVISDAKCINSGKNYLYKVTLSNGATITCSENQPFFIKHGTVKKLKQLKIGETKIIAFDQGQLEKNYIDKIDAIGNEYAYDLVVPQYHNYITVNGILTHNTNDAQAALRRPMELAQQGTSNRLIFTVNRSYKIIEPLMSRCANFYFKPLNNEHIQALIFKIFKGENIEFGNMEDAQAAFKIITEKAQGDARQAVNIIEKIMNTDPGDIISVLKRETVEVKMAEETFNYAVKGDWENCLRSLESLLISQQTNETAIIEMFYTGLETVKLEPAKKFPLYKSLADTERAIKIGTNPLIQFSGFLMTVIGVTYTN
jgi:DNA polymerase III delta prime subunit